MARRAPEPEDAPGVATDGQRALWLIREMLASGVVPKSVSVGDVRLEVGGLVRSTEPSQPPRPGSYLERALNERPRK